VLKEGVKMKKFKAGVFYMVNGVYVSKALYDMCI